MKKYLNTIIPAIGFIAANTGCRFLLNNHVKVDNIPFRSVELNTAVVADPVFIISHLIMMICFTKVIAMSLSGDGVIRVAPKVFSRQMLPEKLKFSFRKTLPAVLPARNRYYGKKQLMPDKEPGTKNLLEAT